MIYLELNIVTEDGPDWIDLIRPDEIDDVINNWRVQSCGPARLVSCDVMSGPRVDYALHWHNHPGATLNDICQSINDIFPTT